MGYHCSLFLYIQNQQMPLRQIEHIRDEKDDMILRVPFLIKESALIWVREIFVEIQKKGRSRIVQSGQRGMAKNYATKIRHKVVYWW